ncbi:unannotated protein [freshwater metagenome]|uniref:Unannotated protein n=1 Tax=freshwater metagenome TaxID=449393 RepID=A0A6J7F9T1_9ZZZZ|nr:hypothetical protein [Actinomycetota bacterium]
MPITSRPGDDLRGRAHQLRRTAGAIDDSGADGLYRRAGVDTWMGPTAARCLDELTTARRQLHEAAEALRRTARQLDQRADQADALTRLTTARGLPT